MTTWNDVQIGDWVRGKDGALWSVADRRVAPAGRFAWTLERKDRKPFVIEYMPSAPGPEIVRSADAMVADAVDVVAETLGGRVLHSEVDGFLACPPEYAEPGALMAHLHILHGSRFSDDGDVTLAALISLHDAKHKAGGHTPHQHTPDYLKRNRRDA